MRITTDDRDTEFGDAGPPTADDQRLKVELVHKIDRILKDRGLTQTAAAALLRIKQPDVSRLLRGQVRQVSVGRLLKFLVVLGHDVEIVVKLPPDLDQVPTLRVA